MNDLRELYQEVIFDHNRHPRNFGKLEGATHEADGYNPLCGDRLHLYLILDNDKCVERVTFEGEGCAISTASASLLTEALQGRSEAEARALLQDVVAMATGNVVNTDALGKLSVLSGVQEFPARVKCATLAWHTLESALDQNDTAVTTE
ncbi:MAG TPA: SUF system NifU family Fe-S cluster assembly protein [Gammaproteobacteria bacterium]|nr:SUF system NifU family Fe-S cluster assembly protein [Gammaproteobacteria bacterium]